MNKQNKISKILKVVILLIMVLVLIKIGQVLIYSYSEGEANKGRAESYREYIKDTSLESDISSSKSKDGEIATATLGDMVSASQKYDWCMSNGGKYSTPDYNAPKFCVLKNKVYQSKCVENDKYIIISKDAVDVGSDILIKYKKLPGQIIPCVYSKGDADFELQDAGNVLALENNFLILDEGTGPYPRVLIIFDLLKKKNIYEDSYSGPVTIKDNKINYWSDTSEKATKENCLNFEKYESSGLLSGSAIEAYVTLDLLTLSKIDLGQRRCVPIQ